MAELAIISLVGSLVGAGGKLYFQLDAIIESVKDAPEELRAVKVELSALTTLIGRLDDLMSHEESCEFIFPFESSAQEFRDVLDACMRTFKELGALVQKYREMSFKQEVKWALFGLTTLNKLRTRLETYKSSINLTLLMANR
jgi:hypothetical protein